MLKVLLCSPFSIDSRYTQGGIVVWAQSIVNYYKTLSSGIQMDVIPFDRRVRPDMRGGMFSRVLGGAIDYWSSIRKTRVQLRAGNYDVLHLCSSASISLVKDIVVLRMAKRKGVKTTIHFHFGRIPELAELNNWEWKMLSRVVRIADNAITMDRRSYNTLREKGFLNVYYWPNPLSLNVIRQVNEEAPAVKKVDRKICFVGHVIPTKGVYELVEACNGIEGIKLYILGESTQEVRNRMMKIAGDADWLVFVGEVNHRQVISEMLSSSIFVLPSYTEGFPNVILESMACGCAIVATTVGAIPDMLAINSDEPCGLCCEPKDIDGLRRSIQFFIDNPDKAQEYGARAINRVNDMYAIPRVWEQMVEQWHALLS